MRNTHDYNCQNCPNYNCPNVDLDVDEDNAHYQDIDEEEDYDD